MRRILVTGDRNWECFGLATTVIKQLAKESAPDEIVIVHGNCRGVDRSFKSACEFMGIKHEPHEAEWNKYPKNTAGPIRNTEMVKLGADLCLAFHPDLMGRSKGTWDCVKKAMKADIPVYHCEVSCPLSLKEIVGFEGGRIVYSQTSEAVPA